jgi:hypothetical protein
VATATRLPRWARATPSSPTSGSWNGIGRRPPPRTSPPTRCRCMPSVQANRAPPYDCCATDMSCDLGVHIGCATLLSHLAPEPGCMHAGVAGTPRSRTAPRAGWTRWKGCAPWSSNCAPPVRSVAFVMHTGTVCRAGASPTPGPFLLFRCMHVWGVCRGRRDGDRSGPRGTLLPLFPGLRMLDAALHPRRGLAHRHVSVCPRGRGDWELLPHVAHGQSPCH